MTDPTFHALQIVNAAAFVVVGLAALRDWWRGRELSRAYLAIAMGCLGLVAITALLAPLTDYAPGLSAVVVVLFMASAAGLLLYRDNVLSLPTWGRVLAALVLAGTTFFTLTVGVSTDPNAKRTTVQAVAGLGLVLVWSGCVIEPAIRLWSIARRLRAVQRARMRSLSAGYAGLAAVVLLSVGAAYVGATDKVVQYLLQLFALGVVPLVYFRLAPPSWLRRIWRQSEEEGLLGAIQELLLFSPDRPTLASRGLDWGIRLVGGDAGLVADAGPELLALQGLSDSQARELLSHRDLFSNQQLLSLEDGHHAIVHQLPVEIGTGVLVIKSGPLSPVFGSEEVERLRGYAAAITVALDRARVSEEALRKEAELSEARDVAEAASRAKSEFLSRMSHELRTPLTAMMGFAELLELDDISDQQRRYIATILKAGDHLLALINDVLDIARIEEGRLSMSLEPLEVADIIREVFELTRPMADDRGITVRIDAAADGLLVIADRQRLKQVLLNLVSNAVKYNRPQGSVVIASQLSPEDRMRFVVADTGQGLHPEEIARLFSPFERLTATRTDIEGTGLGLALSKSLTEAMRGQIGVDSTPGAGSSFWVELPVADAELANQAEALVDDGEAAEVAGEPMVILYVEDTVSNIRLVEGVLSRRPNITLITAMQGSLAMELARQHHPDLILLDVHLPDIEGIDLLQQFRAEPLTAHVPVVMLSADATQHQIERFLAAGAADYMTKPIRVGLLLATLDKHLSPEQSTSEAGAAVYPTIASST